MENVNRFHTAGRKLAGSAAGWTAHPKTKKKSVMANPLSDSVKKKGNKKMRKTNFPFYLHFLNRYIRYGKRKSISYSQPEARRMGSRLDSPPQNQKKKQKSALANPLIDSVNKKGA